MKFCFVLDHGYTSKNGSHWATRPNFFLLDRIVKVFDEVTILCRNRDGDYENEFRKIPYSKVKVILLKDFRSISDFIKIFNYNKKRIKTEVSKADVVMGLGFNGAIALHAAKKQQIPGIVFVGGCGWLAMKNAISIQDFVKGFFLYFSQKYMVKKADYAHYVTEFLYERYGTASQNLTISDIRLKLPLFSKITARTQKLAEKKNEVFTLGLIGYTHTTFKGIDTAIKALAFLGKEFHLEVVGRGDHRWLDKIALEKGVGDRVRFLGTINETKKMQEWLDALDVYIQPSRTEGLPRATIEAMSRGCPVIASNIEGLKDLVNKDYLIKPGDAKTLAEKIKNLTKDKKKQQALILENYQKSKKFDKERVDQLIGDFYQMIYKDAIAGKLRLKDKN